MLLEQWPAAGPGLASISPHVSRDKTLPDFGTLYEVNVAAMVRHHAEGGAGILMGVTFTLGFPLPVVAAGRGVTLCFPPSLTFTFKEHKESGGLAIERDPWFAAGYPGA